MQPPPLLLIWTAAQLLSFSTSLAYHLNNSTFSSTPTLSRYYRQCDNGVAASEPENSVCVTVYQSSFNPIAQFRNSSFNITLAIGCIPSLEEQNVHPDNTFSASASSAEASHTGGPVACLLLEEDSSTVWVSGSMPQTNSSAFLWVRALDVATGTITYEDQWGITSAYSELSLQLDSSQQEIQIVGNGGEWISTVHTSAATATSTTFYSSRKRMVGILTLTLMICGLVWAFQPSSRAKGESGELANPDTDINTLMQKATMLNALPIEGEAGAREEEPSENRRVAHAISSEHVML